MIDLYQLSLKGYGSKINELGWEKASAEYPLVKAYLDATAGEKFERAWKSGYYKHVASIDAYDLENAFRIGNIGPKEDIERYAPMHSVSVGDVLVLKGEAYAVAPFGFESLGPWYQVVT